jgi:cyd operon protein YbgT
MWYFAWLLGLPLAAAFGVLNAMWYELMDDAARQRAVEEEAAPVVEHANAV